MKKDRKIKPPPFKIRALFYIILTLHMPWTLIRALFALMIKIDTWCDKTIHRFINENSEK